MITETFLEVLKHEGVVAIVSQGDKEPHVINTWNSYIAVAGDQKIVIPVGGMKKTEENINKNNNIKVTLGAREVQGLRYMGTGFLVEGKASFLYNGKEFDQVKEKYTWARAALVIVPEKVTQTL